MLLLWGRQIEFIFSDSWTYILCSVVNIDFVKTTVKFCRRKKNLYLPTSPQNWGFWGFFSIHSQSSILFLLVFGPLQGIFLAHYSRIPWGIMCDAGLRTWPGCIHNTASSELIVVPSLRPHKLEFSDIYTSLSESEVKYIFLMGGIKISLCN